jgi:type I restriction enzyme M protein
VLNRHKNNGRKGQFLLINASSYFVKEKPKNRLTDEGVTAVAEVFRDWETREKLSRVVTLEEVREADYNLSPSLFVETNDRKHHRPLNEILPELRTAQSNRAEADRELSELLERLGIAH